MSDKGIVIGRHQDEAVLRTGSFAGRILAVEPAVGATDGKLVPCGTFGTTRIVIGRHQDEAVLRTGDIFSSGCPAEHSV